MISLAVPAARMAAETSAGFNWLAVVFGGAVFVGLALLLYTVSRLNRDR